MPIDFNPHFYTNNIQHQVVSPQYSFQNKEIKDTFIKSIDTNYEGM